MTTHELIEGLDAEAKKLDQLARVLTSGKSQVSQAGDLCREAAQAISTLTAEIEELREALEPFADLAEWIAKEMPHKDHDAEEVQIASWPYSLSVGWLRRAHDLVNKGKAQ